MLKRSLDILISLMALIVFFPVLSIFSFLIFIQDFKSPFYVAPRVGKNEIDFKMIKLRSMVVDAHKTGVDSTSSNDIRITTIGKIVRKFKLDELTQLINVFRGEMSLVGPRPNVLNETKLYSEKEKMLLSVKPGITDFASIVFSDEGEILKDSKDPDLEYNQLIRPGKSHLGLFYVNNYSMFMDIALCFLTILSFFSKKTSLGLIKHLLQIYSAEEMLIKIASRDEKLKPSIPPGMNSIVTKR
tara:strand:- start:5130 stop:5858 length:729 start_codon:yes stop_codon:yes gene_type:complete